MVALALVVIIQPQLVDISIHSVRRISKAGAWTDRSLWPSRPAVSRPMWNGSKRNCVRSTGCICALADFDNYPRRVDRERARAARSRKREIILSLLGVPDRFDRA